MFAQPLAAISTVENSSLAKAQVLLCDCTLRHVETITVPSSFLKIPLYKKQCAFALHCMFLVEINNYMLILRSTNHRLVLFPWWSALVSRKKSSLPRRLKTSLGPPRALAHQELKALHGGWTCRSWTNKSGHLWFILMIMLVLHMLEILFSVFSWLLFRGRWCMLVPRILWYKCDLKV